MAACKITNEWLIWEKIGGDPTIRPDGSFTVVEVLKLFIVKDFFLFIFVMCVYIM